MSFLEKEDEKPSALWDWVIGIGLIVLVAGFTVFYQYQKRYSRESFSQADSLFQSGKFREAANLYQELKNAQYLTTTHDSLIYARLDSVESMEEQEAEAVGRIRSKLAAGDTAGVRAELEAPFRGLLPAEEQTFLDSVKAALKG
jgi:hypothetical protein